MSGQAELDFADVESLRDLATLVSRARAVDEAGGIRLQATGGVLAAWVCVLPGRGLLGEGVVLGLRVMPLARDHRSLDLTVPLSGLGDRFARRERTGDVSTRLGVPPVTLAEPWTALTPPRSGWERAGDLPVERLLQAARQGIAEVAQGTPEHAGGHAVAALRQQVWSRALPGTGTGTALPQVPAGAGLAAYALGFAREGETVALHRAGPWTRLTLAAGHVLTR